MDGGQLRPPVSLKVFLTRETTSSMSSPSLCQDGDVLRPTRMACVQGAPPLQAGGAMSVSKTRSEPSRLAIGWVAVVVIFIVSFPRSFVVDVFPMT